MKTASDIAVVRKRAGWIASGNLALGALAMLQSLSEGSTAWALFIWLTALQGIAIGFLAGSGWSDHQLDRAPAHRKTNGTVGCAWGLLTYWAPILATFMFSLIMAKTLPDAARPQSSLDGKRYRMLVPIMGHSLQRVWMHLADRLAPTPEKH